MPSANQLVIGRMGAREAGGVPFYTRGADEEPIQVTIVAFASGTRGSITVGRVNGDRRDDLNLAPGFTDLGVSIDTTIHAGECLRIVNHNDWGECFFALLKLGR